MSERAAADAKGLALACALAAALVVPASAAAQSSPQPVQRLPAPAKAAAAAPDAGDAVFAAWDANHDGMLSRAEFQHAWDGLRERAEARVESRLREQFDKVDANGNGAVDAGEYGNLLLVKRAGKSAPPLSAFDANHDGKLAFGEYLALVGRLAATPPPAGGKSP